MSEKSQCDWTDEIGNNKEQSWGFISDYLGVRRIDERPEEEGSLEWDSEEGKSQWVGVTAWLLLLKDLSWRRGGEVLWGRRLLGIHESRVKGSPKETCIFGWSGDTLWSWGRKNGFCGGDVYIRNPLYICILSFYFFPCVCSNIRRRLQTVGWEENNCLILLLTKWLMH